MARTATRLTIDEVEFHRNGIGGEPFYVVTFRDENEDRDMVAVLFPNDAPVIPGGFVNPRTAVFDRNLLGQGNIAFGQNSWRGDNYDPQLRQALKEAGADSEGGWY